MALRFFVAIALSALIGSSCGRPTQGEPGSSKAEPYIVYPKLDDRLTSYGQKNDISFLYNWLKRNSNQLPWKPVPENKPVLAEPVPEPKPETFYPYMPKLMLPPTHEPKDTHSVTHTRTDHLVQNRPFVPFPHMPTPFPPYGFPSRFQVPPFPYPPMRPVYRPFPPVFGYPFFQQQQEKQKQDSEEQQEEHKPISWQQMMPPRRGPFQGPFVQPPMVPPFSGIPYGQQPQGRFGGFMTNVYNSLNNAMYNNRGGYNFGRILNKGSSAIPFLPKPYPYVPFPPRGAFPPPIYN